MTVGAALWLGFGSRQLNLGWAYDQYLPLMSATIVLSAALALAVYLASFRSGPLLSTGGHTGWVPANP